jgi:hypothetical protein
VRGGSVTHPPINLKLRTIKPSGRSRPKAPNPNSKLLQHETGVGIDSEQLPGGVEKYDARAPTGQRLKFIGPLRWRFEPLQQSGGAQALCNARCGVAQKLDVIAAYG